MSTNSNLNAQDFSKLGDLYGVLGVASTASTSEIKTAFRKLARELHPDVNPDDPRADEKFRHLQEAYAILSDDSTRARYDRFLKSPPASPGFARQSPVSGTPFDDLFADLFNGTVSSDQIDALLADLLAHGFSAPGARPRKPSQRPYGFSSTSRSTKGQDVVRPLTVPLREAVLGFSTDVSSSVAASRMCASCRTDPSHRATCSKCTNKATFAVPAGIADGTRLRVKGAGAPSTNGGPPGDLFLDVSVAPDSVWDRQGSSLRRVLHVSLSDAILGKTVPVDTFYGRVDMKIPPGCQHGHVVEIPGHGSPTPSNPRPGSAFVTVLVDIPSKLSKKQKKLLEDFAISLLPPPPKTAQTPSVVIPTTDGAPKRRRFWNRRR